MGDIIDARDRFATKALDVDRLDVMTNLSVETERLIAELRLLLDREPSTQRSCIGGATEPFPHLSRVTLQASAAQAQAAWVAEDERMNDITFWAVMATAAEWKANPPKGRLRKDALGYRKIAQALQRVGLDMNDGAEAAWVAFRALESPRPKRATA